MAPTENAAAKEDGKAPAVQQKKTSHCLSTVHRNLPISKVVVHPLVLLSVVDHFTRVQKSTHMKRVVGVLLGSVKQNKVLDIANSFAVPFDEDNSNNWFLDHDYLENMYSMFHKVAARERIVGWYHTGPKLHQNDIAVNELLKQFTPNPVLVIIEAQPEDLRLPTEAYMEVEEVHDDGTPPVKTFEHVPSEIGAEEAEEVGVEHLLRDIKDQTAGTLSQRVTNQLMGLRGLHQHLDSVREYIKAVCAGDLPMNHSIMYLLQDALNLLPNVSEPQFVRSSTVQTNDQMMAIYLGSLSRTVISLHNLIDNKLSLREKEREGEKEAEAKKDAAAATKDKPSDVPPTDSKDTKKSSEL